MKMKPMQGQLRSHLVSSLLKFVSILDPYRAVRPRSNLIQAPMKGCHEGCMEAVEELLMKMKPMQGQLRSYLVSALQSLQMDLHQLELIVRTQGGQLLLGQKVFRERCLASSGSQFGCHIANLTINVHNLEVYISNVQKMIFCHSFTSTAVSLVWKEWELYLNSRHGSKKRRLY